MQLRVALVTLLAATTLAQTPASSVPLNGNFKGDWAGTLEYRDFKTDAQTFLPAWLTITPSADGTSIKLHYIYDDGPAKTVTEDATLTFLPAVAKASLADGKVTDTFDVEGLAEFSKLGRGTLILTGPGKENNHAVDVRLTLTLRRNLYTLRKETRDPGQAFRFRDAYTFTRLTPSALKPDS